MVYRNNIGEAVETLHHLVPFYQEGISVDTFRLKISTMPYEDLLKLTGALKKIYEHFGHRIDRPGRICLVCDGNPRGEEE